MEVVGRLLCEIRFRLYPGFWDRILLKGLDCNDPYPSYCANILILDINYAPTCLILHLVRILEHLSLGAFWSFDQFG